MAEVDGFTIYQPGKEAIFFGGKRKSLGKGKLWNQLSQLEFDFYRKNPKADQEKKTPKYILPEFKKPIFKATSIAGPIHKRELVKTSDNKERWRTLTLGHETKGYQLKLMGGLSTLQKLNKADPTFLYELFNSLDEKLTIGPYGEKSGTILQRFDINCDFNQNLLPDIITSLKKNHFNSFGKGIYAMPASDSETDSDNEKEKKKKKKKAERLTKNKIRSEKYLRDLETRVKTLSIGNFKKSAITVCIYMKQAQMSSVKKSFGLMQTRIVCTHLPKKQNGRIFYKCNKTIARRNSCKTKNKTKNSSC